MNDKLKGWRADGGAFPTHERISGDGDELYDGSTDETLVLDFLAKRSIARKEQEFETSRKTVM